MDQMDFQKIKSKLENFCAYQERSQYEVEKKLNTLKLISEDKKAHYFAFESKQFFKPG